MEIGRFCQSDTVILIDGFVIDQSLHNQITVNNLFGIEKKGPYHIVHDNITWLVVGDVKCGNCNRCVDCQACNSICQGGCTATCHSNCNVCQACVSSCNGCNDGCTSIYVISCGTCTGGCTASGVGDNPCDNCNGGCTGCTGCTSSVTPGCGLCTSGLGSCNGDDGAPACTGCNGSCTGATGCTGVQCLRCTGCNNCAGGSGCHGCTGDHSGEQWYDPSTGNTYICITNTGGCTSSGQGVMCDGIQHNICSGTDGAGSINCTPCISSNGGSVCGGCTSNCTGCTSCAGSGVGCSGACTSGTGSCGGCTEGTGAGSVGPGN